MGIENLRKQFEESDFLFNVDTDDLVTTGGAVVDGKKAIINHETGKVIGIVSDRYRVVTNHEVLDNLLAAVEEADLNLDGAYADIKVGYGGGRSMVDLRFPNHKIDVKGDKSCLSITTLNSYDGRWKFQQRAGVLRFACMNGQILGNFVSSYSEFHNAKLDPSRSAERIVKMVDDFSKAEPWFNALMERKITDDQAIRVIKNFTGADWKDGEEPDSKAATRILELSGAYFKEMGKTSYALYNALTDFVSHKDYSKPTGISNKLFLEQKLSTVISKEKLFAMA